mmetsp:Transcript_32602/g.29458  ORF Transcript_32602/g.29458 Transcript_32602/m.29458 type:complete len:85 (+) Transcript_32602:776-1030(+)|eukprot:CAMPEP_0114583174 /NCGR_PEP_ID=MMETSP0125-20121206/6977_1 /TAXON_ID=485358 ORGANISM="Aristerostoma sp., Strain ATCC 50986" /NCGR_SAMPLE_ID=MMETSP0125 /ASSEMBLY_ACC=CAM_ASM_000245 /LENGTH=84 /DNA_ID=CAMNT_0001776507 /DNA_START=686 /DNA_END=940 /DNA_ORIENTATION=-
MDTIIKLNQSGITIVMVTHDVNLKVFANRIVRMLDGKVQQIVQNSEESRNEAIDELKKTISEYTNPENHGEENDVLGVREGITH